MSVTYSSYLKIDELLSLQQPSEGPEGVEHDEMLFIIIHQVYELWFKQTLHELDRLSHLFRSFSGELDATADILLAQRRALTILKTMVAQIDILETMTPISFSSFRSRLDTASGFQSPQFRELEFLLGHRDQRMLKHHQGNPAALERLQKRSAEPTLFQSFLKYLEANGYAVPAAALTVYSDGGPRESAEIQTSLIRLYREDHRLTQVCERLVDFDEGLQEWRYRHVKMVERTIGRKPGTGGSMGADYLQSTLFQPSFPDLWAIRSEL
jgi:tryptophan 2,3-dioxygenase